MDTRISESTDDYKDGYNQAINDCMQILHKSFNRSYQPYESIQSVNLEIINLIFSKAFR
jgi:hypothetical protein